MSTRLTLSIALFLALTATAAQAVTIVTPRPGDSVKAGSQILIIIEADPDEVLTQVGVVTANGTVIATPLPLSPPNPPRFQAIIDVPVEAFGPELIVVIGRREDRSLSDAYVQVTAEAGTLDHIELTAPKLLIRSGEIVALSVKGLFSDKVERDLTLAERGTVYATSDSAIVAVNADGLAQSRLDGTVVLTVTNGDKSASAIVKVSIPEPTGIPTVDPGPDTTVNSGATVVLDGSASRDPDGDPITYRWKQLSGPGQTIADMTSATLTFTAPTVTEMTVLEFALMVTDDRRASSLPASVRVSVTPQ